MPQHPTINEDYWKGRIHCLERSSNDDRFCQRKRILRVNYDFSNQMYTSFLVSSLKFTRLRILILLNSLKHVINFDRNDSGVYCVIMLGINIPHKHDSVVYYVIGYK